MSSCHEPSSAGVAMTVREEATAPGGALWRARWPRRPADRPTGGPPRAGGLRIPASLFKETRRAGSGGGPGVNSTPSPPYIDYFRSPGGLP